MPVTADPLTHRYRVLAPLGAGGMGTVYHVYDRLTGQPAALKRINVAAKNLRFSRPHDGANPNLAFAEEFRLLASLHHPNIISVYDYGFDDLRQPYYVMSLIDDAQSITNAAQNRDLMGCIHLLTDVLHALIYMHRRGVLHRDLKPENALVDAAGRARLVDFGLSVEGTHALGMSGTLAYMAPETLRDGVAQFASDLYSVGVIAYEMLAGKHPFFTRSLSLLFKRVLEDAPDLAPLQAPDALKWVIARLLAKDPTDRYDSAAEALKALYAAVELPLPEESRAIRDSFLSAARFIGRQVEQQLLAGALNAGRGSAWLIGGEAGVGKSRLLEEIRIRALVSGMSVVRGQAVEGGGYPYQVLRGVLPTLILGCAVSPLEAGVLLPLVPEIGRLLERPVEPAAALEPGEMGERLKHVILDLFRRQRKPLLLLLEDLHWAEDTLGIIAALIHAPTQYPLVILASYRSDEAPRLPDHLPGARVLPLPRLGAQEVETLSASMLDRAGRQPELIQFLVKQTEGNAFFIVDILRALAEDVGRLDYIGMMTLPESVLSKGVLAVAQRRLERIPPEHYRQLYFAAVVGREIDFALMDAVFDPTRRAWLDHALESAILEPMDGGLRFSHDRVREGILHYADPALLTELHQRAAQTIEQVYAGDKRYFAVLARHWGVAGDAEREARYSLAAGTTALRLSQFTQAQRCFERALALLPESDPRWLEAHNELGKLYTMIGKFDAARALYQPLLDRPDAPPLLYLDALATSADVARRLGDPAAARQLGQQAYELAVTMGHVEGRARALATLVHLRLKTEPLETVLPLYHEMMALFPQIENVEIRRELLTFAMKMSLVADRLLSDHQAVIERLLGYLEQDQPNLRAFAQANLGALYVYTKQYEKAEAALRETITIAAEIGNMHRQANAWSNLALMYAQQGNYARALEPLQKAIRFARDYHMLPLLVSCVYLAARVKWYLGDRIVAVAWIMFMLEHPAVELDVRHFVRADLDTILPELMPDEIEQGKALGATLTLEAVYAVIDAELMPP